VKSPNRREAAAADTASAGGQTSQSQNNEQNIRETVATPSALGTQAERAFQPPEQARTASLAKSG